MDECLFLTRLPTEIRLRIYEDVLAFERPLKLRQVVAGSKNTGILRANRQIYNEALPIFYDVNTIMVSRNDFCLVTDPALQTPLCRDQVRNLLVKNFSQSIRCSSFSGGNNMYLAGCCDVCKPNATSFITAVAGLPRIQSVIVDYHNHAREFQFIKGCIQGIGASTVDPEQALHYNIQCTDVARYKLTSHFMPSNLSFVFMDLPIYTIWNELNDRGALMASKSPSSFEAQEQVMRRLRDEVDREIADKIYLYWRLYPARRDDPNLSASCSGAEGCTQELSLFCTTSTAERARAGIGQLRSRVPSESPQ